MMKNRSFAIFTVQDDGKGDYSRAVCVLLQLFNLKMEPRVQLGVKKEDDRRKRDVRNYRYWSREKHAGGPFGQESYRK